jgi:Fur family ferric uptake transcriptional regulator
MNKVIGDVEEKLRAKEYKLTPKREHILRVLLEHKDQHLSAEEVYNLVKERVPDVGLATVYRTLDLFWEFDIIHGTDFGDGRKRYEFGSAAERHRHHHLICTECGDIIEVAEDLLEELEDRVSKKYKFEISDHELKIFGRCAECVSGIKNE